MARKRQSNKSRKTSVSKKKAKASQKKPLKKASSRSTSRLTKAEMISKIPIENIASKSGQAGTDELRAMVRTLMTGYKRRAASLDKRGLVSHAKISLESSLEGTTQRKIKDMTRNQLLLEFARYSKFFNDKTSSQRGIEEVNAEQDKRIFGTDGSGRPARSMDDMERRKFWAVYDEYNNLHPTGIAAFSSETIQKAIGRISLTGKDFNLMDSLNEVHEILEREYRDRTDGSVPNVFSGRGDN